LASSSRISLLILCGLALPIGAAAAEPRGEPVAQLDEVDVVGKKLRALHREVIEAENRFYERFNAINTNDDFNIYCDMDKATGTNIPQRRCRIKFLMDAEAIDAREFLQGLTSASSARGVGTPIAALVPQWVQRREEYRQTAKALLEKDPELLALGAELVRLQAQYERVRKERQKDKIILLE
jgi:hypothetical protein